MNWRNSHATSEWRLDAFINVADQARRDNDLATYQPLYRACATGFAKNDHSVLVRLARCLRRLSC